MMMNEQSLARGLAVFSIGLGIAQLIAPRKVAELIGLNDDHDNLMRMLGAREIASGLGILQGSPAQFLSARVAGDMLDLGLLSVAFRDERNDRDKLEGAIVAVAAVTALDVMACVMHDRLENNRAEPSWRVREPEGYEGAISKDNPHSLRASTDQAMSEHQSGHVYRGDVGTRVGGQSRQQFSTSW